MTAEIALLSKEAIIVGYDISDMGKYSPEFKQKRSGTKSYRLPSQHKIGVVNYRNNRIMNVLLNDVMEEFIQSLPQFPLQDVADYLNHFMEIIKTSHKFINSSVVENHLINLTIEMLEHNVNYTWSQFQTHEVPYEQFSNTFSDVLGDFYHHTPEIPAGWGHFVEQYQPLIKNFIRQFPVGGVPLPEVTQKLTIEQLATSILYHICNGSSSRYDAEIVFFGFGEANDVPGLFTLKVQSIFEEILIGKLGISTSYSLEQDENEVIVVSLKAGSKGDKYHNKAILKEEISLGDLLLDAQSIVQDIAEDTAKQTDFQLLNKREQYIVVTKEDGVHYLKE